MKKLFYLFGIMLLTATVFTSCSEDNENTGSVSDLIGTWIPVEGIGINMINGKVDWKENLIENMYIWEFKADGTYYGYGSNDNVLYEEAEYIYKNGKLTLIGKKRWRNV